MYNRNDLGSFCGGTLVASKYVISAAHCFFSTNDDNTAVTGTKTAADVRIRIGDHNLDSEGEEKITPKFVNIKTLTNHPSYNPLKIEDGFDITVLELEEELDLNVYTPACLAKTSDTTTFDGNKLNK